jgi:hypothetical protein
VQGHQQIDLYQCSTRNLTRPKFNSDILQILDNSISVLG